MTVKQILDSKGRNVVTVNSSMTIIAAARFLSENKIGAVVVSDDGEKINGILSERDIVRAVAKLGSDCLDAAVSSIMTKAVITVDEDRSINQVMEIMTRGRFRHLPVANNSKLVGIVSIGDVVRRRIDDVEREAAEIKAYISG